MKSLKKTVSLFLTVMMLTGMFVSIRPEMKSKADVDVATPTFILESVNSGTGVKITINKTKGATHYYISMTKRDNAYKNYLYNSGDYADTVVYLKNSGKAKTTYTINGLPKGTYSFAVSAYSNTEYSYSDVSAEKSIYVKAAKKKATIEKKYDFSKAKVGDTIKFGSYEQDDYMTNGKEEIEWIVLAKDNKKMLVLSKYALDCLPYNIKNTDITWENSTIRKWLNSKFYTTAFTKKERAMIKKVKIKNNDHWYYETEGGNDTKDRIFLMSLDDISNAKYGFGGIYDEDLARSCAATEYAKVQGARTCDKFFKKGDWSYFTTIEGEPTCCWWLRSPGMHTYEAAYVKEQEGEVDYTGIDVEVYSYSVRPALYISLKS